MLARALPVAVAVAVLAGCTTATTSGNADGPEPAEEAASRTQRIPYGDHPDQWLDLTVPAGQGPFPVVVLLHGGFWREPFRADLMEDLAGDVVARGRAAANVEYRRVGGAGGWPATFEDVAAAVDALAAVEFPTRVGLDLDRVVLVGHSAGGHLALWAAARGQLPPGAPGAGPAVLPCAVVSQAGVADLAEAALVGLGGGAVVDLLGGLPEELPARYDVADPRRLLPIGVPVLAVQGRADAIVPAPLVVSWVDAAEAAGDDVTYLPVDGDHFVVLDPGRDPWSSTMAWVDERC